MKLPFSKKMLVFSTLHKLVRVHRYLPESISSRNFEKFPFNRNCRHKVCRVKSAIKNGLLTKFIKFRILENFQEKFCKGIPS